MIKMALPTTVILAIIIFIVTALNIIKPSILILNNTNETIYTYPGYSIYGIEPDDEEAALIKKMQPGIIEPGKILNIKLPLRWLLKENVSIGLGWRTGGNYQSISKNAGGQTFMIDQHKGACSIIMTFNDNNFTMVNRDTSLCLKKIRPIYDKYNTQR